MQTKTYNGWTNYETWGVALVIDDDHGTYTFVREQLAEILDTEDDKDTARHDFADFLKDFTEELCGLGTTA